MKLKYYTGVFNTKELFETILSEFFQVITEQNFISTVDHFH